MNGRGSTKPTAHGQSRGRETREEDRGVCGRPRNRIFQRGRTEPEVTMPSGPHDKKGQDKDRTGGSPPAHVPQRTSNLDIFSQEPVGQASLEELLAPEAAAAASPEGIAWRMDSDGSERIPAGGVSNGLSRGVARDRGPCLVERPALGGDCSDAAIDARIAARRTGPGRRGAGSRRTASARTGAHCPTLHCEDAGPDHPGSLRPRCRAE